MPRFRARTWRTLGRAALLLLVVIVLLPVAYLASYRVDGGALRVEPRPARSYAEAIELAQRLLARDDSTINEACRTTVLDHGRRTEQVAVLFHGFTNCPAQFRLLGEQLYERGYNVVIPRLPRHGLTDRLTDDLSRLTAAEVVRTASEAVDVAAGLGEQITTLGLSGGGALAALLALERPDIASAVMLAPGFCPFGVPGCLVEPLIAAVDVLPDRYVWWDPILQDKAKSTPYAYPRFSVHAAAEFFKIGVAAQRAADQPTRSRPQLALVTVENDLVIDNAAAQSLVARWSAHDGLPLETYQFPATAGLDHDIVDPLHENARVDLVYPKLLELTR